MILKWARAQHLQLLYRLMTHKKYNILLAEDDDSLGAILKDYLELKGYSVSWVKNGKQAVESASDNINLCVMDVMMPLLDGFTAAKQILKSFPNLPVIFLTAKNMQSDINAGLKMGAEDYIVKPFDTEELLLRINVALKRTAGGRLFSRDGGTIKIGNYKFMTEERKLLHKKDEISLTAKETKLLLLLVESAGSLLSRQTALMKIWGDDNYFNSRSMDVYISKLRGYLIKDKSLKIITVHGEGYKFIC